MSSLQLWILSRERAKTLRRLMTSLGSATIGEEPPTSPQLPLMYLSYLRMASTPMTSSKECLGIAISWPRWLLWLSGQRGSKRYSLLQRLTNLKFSELISTKMEYFKLSGLTITSLFSIEALSRSGRPTERSLEDLVSLSLLPLTATSCGLLSLRKLTPKLTVAMSS